LLRDAPDLDPEATKALIAKSNPARAGTTFSSTRSLGDVIYPGDGTAFAGVFPGIEILCDRQVMITEADLQEFMRTRTRRRLRLGPGDTLVPIEDRRRTT
jgi:hypothetical protein